jgi:hypothetical protein
MPRSTGAASRRHGGPECWLRLIAVVLLVPAVSACPPKCEVTELEIVPAMVMMGSDPVNPTSLRLEARLWSGPASSRFGLSIAEHPECKLSWKTSQSWLSLDPVGDYGARLSINPGTSPSTSAFVTVTAGDLTTAPGAEIRVLPGTVPSQDMVSAEYLAGGTPSAVVVNGTPSSGGAPPGPWVSAFVRRGVVGQEDASPDGPGWAAAVLDAAHGTVMYPGPWTPGQDQIGPPPPPVAVRSIPVALRIAVDASHNPVVVLNAAKDDIGAANSVLAENRVGVALEALSIKTIPAAEVGPEFADCLTGDDLTPIDDQPGMLHLFYVGKLGNLTGLTCPATDARPQPVIYIAFGTYSTISLPHEVGHALGLVVPLRGHAENSPGFDASNVMSNVDWDKDPFGRQRFTVGQAFRMNADSASWLNWTTDAAGITPLRVESVPLLGCQCGAADPAGRCPRLGDDVARRRGGLGDSQTWDCDDRLKLPAVGVGERAAGLLAGRRWRDPPGHCTRGLPGSQMSGANQLRFANLTRPGKCPSWAAIFFSGHTPIFRELQERPAMVWTDVSEPWSLSPVPVLEPKRPVTAGVYYPSSEAVPATSQIAEAKWVFGEGNLSGLALTILPHPGPCVPGTGDDVFICYSSSGPTVAQLLGEAFGLPLLTPTEENDPAYLVNVMQPAASKRGDRLTLGQLFLIHSTLKTGDFPNCTLAPESCPPLTADATP